MSGWMDTPYQLGAVPPWDREEAADALTQAWENAPATDSDRSPSGTFDRCPVCRTHGVVQVDAKGTLVHHAGRQFPCRVGPLSPYGGMRLRISEVILQSGMEAPDFMVAAEVVNPAHALDAFEGLSRFSSLELALISEFAQQHGSPQATVPWLLRGMQE